ncbi:MAG TPA: DUF5602 domain-containing protein [Candidatus Eremiobacteraceae bacterium]|nr:DUF5602 domain-containing protein [Candidatus Eremiobacteraceae bacterium]
MRSLRLAGVAVACALVAAAATAHAATMATMAPMPQPPRPSFIPAGNVQMSPCIPTMGSHWANPATIANGGPIYGVYGGKPVFTEIMLTPKDFAAGKSWDEVLKPLPGYAINHVDIDFLPHGHPGMPFPHYDIHAFYVSHATHMAYCGGLPALKKMLNM